MSTPTRLPRLSAELALVIVFAIISVCFNLAVLVYSALDPESRYDFNAEYLMVQALVRGQDPYTSLDVLGARWRPSPYVLFMHPTPHPIFVGWLCLPLAWLTFPQAATVWLALEILCVVASVWIWTRITGPVRPWQGALIVLGLLGWFPLVQEIRHGQLSILLTLLFLGGWLALLRRKEALAGLCLGAMVLIKLIGLPILLWLAWRRRWAAVGWAAVLVVVAHLLAVWIHGWSLIVRFYTVVGPTVARVYLIDPRNVSIWRTSVALLNQDALALMITLAVLVGLLYLTSRATVNTALPLLFGTGLLLSPVAWIHGFVMALPAVGLLARRLSAAAWPGGPTRTAAAALAVVSIPPVFYLDTAEHLGATSLLFANVPVLGLVVMMGLLLKFEDRPR